jgi:parallel beta-helix repeat protein
VDTGGSTTPVGSAWGIAAYGPGASVSNNNVRETIEKEGQSAYGVQISGGPGSVAADNIIGNTAIGTGTSYGIYVKNSANVTVKGNTISNMNKGVHYESDGSGTYLNNVVSGCTTPFPPIYRTPAGLTNYGKKTTRLLYPYVTNQSGMDTGISISNVWDNGEVPQNGTCEIWYFGDFAPSPFVTPEVQSGHVYSFVLSSQAPAFGGYIIAKCNFPRARGWGYVTDIGTNTFSASFTAEVLP